MSGETTNCAEHDWFFEPGDICPVCEGIAIAEARIAEMSEPHTANLGARSRYRQEGKDFEYERITNLAWQWIDEMRGHDGDCGCRHEASILQKFIEHQDFTENR